MSGFVELAARSNFSLLEGASHPEEMVQTAASLGQTGIGLCDGNSLAGVVRAHMEAKKGGLPFVPGARLTLADGARYLAWPVSRRGYGRLTRLISEGRTLLASPDQAPMDQAAPGPSSAEEGGRLRGECRITHEALLEAAGDWCLAALPPVRPDAAFAARLARDAAALRGQLALPLLCACVPLLDGYDHWRIETLRRCRRRRGPRCWRPTTRATTSAAASAWPMC